MDILREAVEAAERRYEEAVAVCEATRDAYWDAYYAHRYHGGPFEAVTVAKGRLEQAEEAVREAVELRDRLYERAEELGADLFGGPEGVIVNPLVAPLFS